MVIFIRNLRNTKKFISLQQNKCRCRKFSSKNKWKSVVGLEIHAQINTVSKLFSGASTSYAAHVNNNVSLFDAAIPGTLPVLNRKCVESGVLTALALNCDINSVSMFDRKHYFYADLPAGYQITQQRKPLANNGVLQFDVYHPGIHKKPYKKISRIKQIQLEQDSGKSLHDEEVQRSLVDLNRAGIPLMEIVFEPDLEDGEEAASLVKELVLILKRLNTCNCKMEEGNLRVDANVSVHKTGMPLGVRSEVKNIGSIRGVAKAINFEVKRQINLLSCGKEVVNETMNWNAETGETVPMRDKEMKQDYRFMPEPNLPPLHVNLSEKFTNNKNVINVEQMKALIPELPEETRSKLITKHSLLPQIAITLVDEELLLSYFNNILNKNERRSPKLIANILVNELLKLANKGLISIEKYNENIENSIGETIDLIEGKKINLLNARLLLEEVARGNKEPVSKIVKERDWQLITDINNLKKLCEDVIKNNPKLVAQYKGGKEKVFKAFLGEVVKISQNRANMEIVDKLLKELLKK